MKQCFECGETKELSSFHKHKAMKDGHLNKCRSCVAAWTKEYRALKGRAKEDVKRRERLGQRPQQEYFEKRRKNAMGRKAIARKYTQKRRQRVEIEMSEFDSFVMDEAQRLVDLRTEMTGSPWHLDHIVPLFHKEASGLHNGHNVQVVPAEWNFKKGNRNMDTFWPIIGY
jgi:hypothetical protein